jgi:hypothetical protein
VRVHRGSARLREVGFQSPPRHFSLPLLGASASGRTNDKREFALTTWRQGDGAVAGDHKVTIETIVIAGYTSDGGLIEVNAMPPKYEKPDTSGFTATISDKGKNVLSFAVEGPSRGPTSPVPTFSPK